MKYIASAIVGTKSKTDRMRPSTLDSVTSVGEGGKYANAMTYTGAELRDIRIVLPYGVSSSALDNIRAQIIVNDENGNASMVGVHDPDRPPVGNGETVIYNSDGDVIRLTHNGISIESSKTVVVNGSVSIDGSMSCASANVSGGIKGASANISGTTTTNVLSASSANISGSVTANSVSASSATVGGKAVATVGGQIEVEVQGVKYTGTIK